MKKLARILAPTDLSPLSRAGVRYALELARAEGAEVIIYYVIGYEEAGSYDDIYRDGAVCSWSYRYAKDLRAQQRALLDRYLKENFDDFLAMIHVRREVEIGTPYRRIIEKAAEEGVEIIVMSTHGKTGLSHIPVGSVAKRVVRHASCAVLSVGPKKQDEARAAPN